VSAGKMRSMKLSFHFLILLNTMIKMCGLNLIVDLGKCIYGICTLGSNNSNNIIISLEEGLRLVWRNSSWVALQLKSKR